MTGSQRYAERERLRDYRVWVLAILPALFFSPAHAKNFRVGDTGVTGSLNTELSIGAIVRTQKRSNDFLGKTNIQGQQNLCDPKFGKFDCTTVPGNDKYLGRAGSAAAINTDNGDLNYSQGNLVSAAVKVTPELLLTYKQFGLDVSGLYFHDFINSNFSEYHPNNFTNNGFQPTRTPRPSGAENDIGQDFVLLNAYASGDLPFVGGRRLHFKIGQQVLNQGQSQFLVFNSLNTINPPDANILNLPGSEIAEVFRPVPLAVLSTNLTPNLTAKGFYQFYWRSAGIPPDGSYFSTSDFVGDGARYLELGVGKAREDPAGVAGRLQRTPGQASLVSNSSETVFRAPDDKPGNQGEYGFSLSYFAKKLNYTTFTLYYRNLHSRIPNVSFKAASQSCAANATTLNALVADCNGLPQPGPETDNDPLPLDTARYFVDYPEDIHSYGLSFQTSIGPAAWSGEAVFRPNQPLQINGNDLLFAALQPAFPKKTIASPIGVIPGRRVGIPDNVETRFRGDTVRPGQTIRGYVRRKTLNLETSFTFINGAQNPFGASDITTVVELGAFEVLNMPDRDKVQLNAPGTRFHRSAGINGTGTPNEQQRNQPLSARQNASYQRGHFADAFSWGYRFLTNLDYKNVVAGVDFIPQFGFFHDVHGTSPGTSRNFVGGRIRIIGGLRFDYEDRIFGGFRYNWYTGGGRYNLLNDRDNLEFDARYAF